MRYVIIGMGVSISYSLVKAESLGGGRWPLLACAVLLTAVVAERFPRD